MTPSLAHCLRTPIFQPIQRLGMAQVRRPFLQQSWPPLPRTEALSDGSIVLTDSWTGPTIRSLANTLTDAVLVNPSVFIDLLPAMLTAKRPYQVGVIEGFKRLWDDDSERHQLVDWQRTWDALIAHFEALLGDPDFWATDERLSDEVLTPNRDWMLALIADFLAAGTKRDEKSFEPQFLDRSRQLIRILLERDGRDRLSDDRMTDAINSNQRKGHRGSVQSGVA